MHRGSAQISSAAQGSCHHQKQKPSALSHSKSPLLSPTPCQHLQPWPLSGMSRGVHARGTTWAVAVPGQTQRSARSLLFSHHPFCRSRSNAERKGSNLDASQKLKFSLGGRKQQQRQASSDAFYSRKMGLRKALERKTYLQHKYQ